MNFPPRFINNVFFHQGYMIVHIKFHQNSLYESSLSTSQGLKNENILKNANILDESGRGIIKLKMEKHKRQKKTKKNMDGKIHTITIIGG